MKQICSVKLFHKIKNVKQNDTEKITRLNMIRLLKSYSSGMRELIGEMRLAGPKKSVTYDTPKKLI
jgi:hypothetical protein